MTTKFADHKYAQAHKEEMFGNTYLYSYDTKVAEIRGGWLRIFGLYSMTTRKHISWFMRELGLTYQLAKKLYEDYMVMNIYTGEVKSV